MSREREIAAVKVREAVSLGGVGGVGLRWRGRLEGRKGEGKMRYLHFNLKSRKRFGV